GTQFLCFGDYMIYKGSNTYSINSCETIEVFYNIRTDIEKLNAASEITKLTYDVTTENQNSYKILQLYLNTLYIISETDKDLELVISIFKMRLMMLIGYKPIVEKCSCCKQPKKLVSFSMKYNGLECEECKLRDTSSIDISPTTLDAIKYIIGCDAKKLYSFDISEESKKELEIIAKLYTKEKIEI
ncbi:MAG: DNA repair protein RecO, partial [Lachnospiraceae bacterium]|nr:DNA repair protein RecO [Lachnospiraceae bacterium]